MPTLDGCIEQSATVARYNLARLVAARHAIWRLRRTGSQPCPDHHTDTDSYVLKIIKFSSSTTAAAAISIHSTTLLLRRLADASTAVSMPLALGDE